MAPASIWLRGGVMMSKFLRRQAGRRFLYGFRLDPGAPNSSGGRPGDGFDASSGILRAVEILDAPRRAPGSVWLRVKFRRPKCFVPISGVGNRYGIGLAPGGQNSTGDRPGACFGMASGLSYVR